MIQCKKWLAAGDLETMYKFIIRVYDLKKVYISVDQAYKLYGQILISSKKDSELGYLVSNSKNRKRKK